MNLSVTLGFTDSGQATLAAARQQVMEAVSDRRAADAFVLLDALCDIDLYDLIEDIWAESPGTINELLMQFEATLKTERCEMNRLLLALEGVAVDPKKLYLDAFNRYSIEPKSFAKNKEREDAGQSNLMIRFEYWLAPNARSSSSRTTYWPLPL